jgi:hypothetical protein
LHQRLLLNVANTQIKILETPTLEAGQWAMTKNAFDFLYGKVKQMAPDLIKTISSAIGKLIVELAVPHVSKSYAYMVVSAILGSVDTLLDGLYGVKLELAKNFDLVDPEIRVYNGAFKTSVDFVLREQPSDRFIEADWEHWFIHPWKRLWNYGPDYQFKVDIATDPSLSPKRSFARHAWRKLRNYFYHSTLDARNFREQEQVRIIGADSPRIVSDIVSAPSVVRDEDEWEQMIEGEETRKDLKALLNLEQTLSPPKFEEELEEELDAELAKEAKSSCFGRACQGVKNAARKTGGFFKRCYQGVCQWFRPRSRQPSSTPPSLPGAVEPKPSTWNRMRNWFRRKPKSERETKSQPKQSFWRRPWFRRAKHTNPSSEDLPESAIPVADPEDDVSLYATDGSDKRVEEDDQAPRARRSAVNGNTEPERSLVNEPSEEVPPQESSMDQQVDTRPEQSMPDEKPQEWFWKRWFGSKKKSPNDATSSETDLIDSASNPDSDFFTVAESDADAEDRIQRHDETRSVDTTERVHGDANSNQQ